MRLAIIALLLAGTAAPALAQTVDPSVPGRVDKLEHEMRAVQRKVFPGANPEYFDPQIAPPVAAPVDNGTPASSAVSDLTQRVSALEQQVQQLTNQAEENGHRLDQLEQNYTKMKGDTDYRLNTLEGHGAPSPANGGMVDAGPPPSATVATSDSGTPPPFGPKGRKPVAGTSAPTMSDEAGDAPPPGVAPAASAAMPALAKTGDPAEDQYMLGYTLWSQKRYADAETQLKAVVAKYPKHKRASYAQNLLGRAYMDDGQLSEAAKAFYTGYKSFPRGERAPDSLYYLGQTLFQLKKNSDACQAYGEFQDVYGATANPTLKARVAQGRADAKCGIDDCQRTRFSAEYEALLSTAALPADAPVGVALSGGPDSIALLILTTSCAIGPVSAMTIDHGLREDSAAEAEAAGRVARSFGVPHGVARVSVAPGGDGLQGEARRARYTALGEWAVANGLAAVLTAHHADDQAETMLMRLSRGSGLTGLTGIRPTRLLDEARPDGLLLLRPLLGWRKAELEAIVAAAGIEPARDPSNANPRFDRTAARRMLAGAPWIDPVRVARSADHLREAEEALSWIVDDLSDRVIEGNDCEVSMPASLPREITRRLLLRLLADRFAKRPDGPAVERAMAALYAGGTVAIADILAHPEGARWHFRAAPPRRSA